MSIVYMTLVDSPPYSFYILILAAKKQPAVALAVLLGLRKREEEEKELQEKNVHRNVKEATHLGWESPSGFR